MALVKPTKEAALCAYRRSDKAKPQEQGNE